MRIARFVRHDLAETRLSASFDISNKSLRFDRHLFARILHQSTGKRNQTQHKNGRSCFQDFDHQDPRADPYLRLPGTAVPQFWRAQRLPRGHDHLRNVWRLPNHPGRNPGRILHRTADRQEDRHLLQPGGLCLVHRCWSPVYPVLPERHVHLPGDKGHRHCQGIGRHR